MTRRLECQRHNCDFGLDLVHYDEEMMFAMFAMHLIQHITAIDVLGNIVKECITKMVTGRPKD